MPRQSRRSRNTLPGLRSPWATPFRCENRSNCTSTQFLFRQIWDVCRGTVEWRAVGPGLQELPGCVPHDLQPLAGRQLAQHGQELRQRTARQQPAERACGWLFGCRSCGSGGRLLRGEPCALEHYPCGLGGVEKGGQPDNVAGAATRQVLQHPRLALRRGQRRVRQLLAELQLLDREAIGTLVPPPTSAAAIALVVARFFMPGRNALLGSASVCTPVHGPERAGAQRLAPGPQEVPAEGRLALPKRGWLGKHL